MAAAVIGCLIAGLGAPPPASTGAAAEPKTFVWGKTGDADTLDINVTSNGEAWEVAAQIFSLLVRTKQGGTDIEPDLATTWSVSPDGLIWTFKLRQGVTYQDGSPWNAEAAKFNIDRWADRNNAYHAVQGYDYAYWNAFMGPSFQEVRAVDPSTLQIILKQPDAPVLYDFAITAFGFNSPAAIKQYGGRASASTLWGPARTSLWNGSETTTSRSRPIRRIFGEDFPRHRASSCA